MKALLENNPGAVIDTKGLGDSFKRAPSNKEHLIVGGAGEESVDELLAKLAKKGKKVHLIDDEDADMSLDGETDYKRHESG